MTDHIPDTGKMVSARDVIACVLLGRATVIQGRSPLADRQAAAVLSALSAAGLAVVPVVPTQAMLLAAPGRDRQDTEASMYHGIWRAMVAAAKDGA